MNFIKKILSKIPKENSDWFRICISFFLVGLLFLAVELFIIPNKNDSKIMTISSICMAFSLFCFPYIDKTKMMDAITKFGQYFVFLIFTISSSLIWLSSISQGNISVIHSIIVAIMLVILLDITLKPIFFIVKSISQKINRSAQNNKNGHFTTAFKTTFTNLSVITAFIISLLTIIKTIFDILEKLNKI